MDFRVFVEPQEGATYADQLRIAQLTEELGFDGFFRSDHYLGIDTDGLPGPTDSWVTLAGLALQTTRIRLGTLVTSGTFRHPGPLAIAVAQVDAMSGGRVELGLGAGWFEREHAAYGIPFPAVQERFDRFEEQLAVVTGLWETPVGDRFDYSGRYYTLVDSPALPKPAQQPRPPVIIGGTGAERTPRLTARYALEFNAPFVSARRCAELFERVNRACVELGRPPESVVRSAVQTMCVGRDRPEVDRRLEAIGMTRDSMVGQGIAGTAAEVVDALGIYAEAGVTRLYLQMLDIHDLDQLELIASDVVPQLGARELASGH
jgi:F420-dependent oxidoreductase-like protein